MKRNAGFTLIEILIVVMIIGILAAIAVPSYSNYVKRGKIAEATSTLSTLRNTMEQYYLDNRTYLTAGGACAVTAVPPAGHYFTFACASPVSGVVDTYNITATGTVAGGMSDFVYDINQANTKTSKINVAGQAPGWKGNAACWATKQDGSC